MAFLTPDKTYEINGVTVKEYLLTEHSHNNKSFPTKKTKPNIGVTIHNTEDIKEAAGTTDAEQYVRATVNGNMGGVFVHYYVDDREAWHCLPDDWIGWHASDGTGAGNYQTIAIEVIGSGTKVEDNAARLAAGLLLKYGMTINNLYTHSHWMNKADGKTGTREYLNTLKRSTKNCPAYILPHWSEFEKLVASYLTKSTADSGAKSFTPRLTAPEKGNKYYIRKSSGGWSPCITGRPKNANCDVLSNCVGYALGRFHEIIGDQSFKYLANTNAENMLDFHGSLKTGSVPQIGAMICWGQGKLYNSADGCGHVAIVEKVIDAETIVTSESAYGGSAFYTKTRKKGNGNWGAGGTYYFRGFIYNPAVKESAIVIEDEKVPTGNITANTSLDKGAKVELKAVPLYASASSKTKANTLTGTYYIHSASIVGGRIRITTPKGNSVVTGWIDVASVAPMASSTEIKVGDKVKIKSGAKTYYGGSLASFVYNQTYVVKEIGCRVSTDYIVVGTPTVVVAAVKASDLIKQ